MAEDDNDSARPPRRPRSAREAIHPDRPPPPPVAKRARNHPVIAYLSGLMTFMVLMIILVGASLYVGKAMFEAPGPLASDRTVTIPSGQGVRSISRLLEREGFVERGWMFLAGVAAFREEDNLKAGEYLIPASASMRDIMDIFVEGRAILHRLTFPEGLTSQRMIEMINADTVLIGGSITEIPAEGKLMPETFSFPRGTTRQEVVDILRREHDRVLAEVWARRIDDLPIETPEEMLTLASIVEKETGRADERARVAGVFVNRLRRGMRLQSDPTILYGLYGGDAWDEFRTILRSELNAPNNPYNTYQIDALPPGPIANVGRAALEAVANPSRTEDLFFVADGTGGHAFARTLEEHNRNVARWREIERERREAEAAAEQEAEQAADEEPAAEDGETGEAGFDPAEALRGLDTSVD
ncbi:MAG: endolytic transglycosylase MltG [Pseudomonadota bacterium]